MDKFTNVLSKKDPSSVSELPVNHSAAHHDEFHSALSNAMKTSPKVKEFVHLYDPQEYAKMKTFLAPDKSSGYAVKDDGDIVSVFSTVKGRGDQIMQHAIKNGGSKLDAFDGFLPKMYAKHGFEEYKREPNWNAGSPDVVYMHRNPSKQVKLAASEDYMMNMTKSEEKSKYYREANELRKSDLNKSEQPMDAQLFMAYDGDNAGRLVGRAILADDPKALHDASNRIAHGHDIVRDWAQSHGGQVISGGGDEGTFIIPSQATEDIEKLRADYRYATQLSMTVGVGHSLSEAGKALMVGKFRGKDQVCLYDQSIETELAQAKQHVAAGQGNKEEQKLDEAYLSPESENNMEIKPKGGEQNQPSDLIQNESPDNHADCEYCAELAQDNVQDEDHCQYCHDADQLDTEPHCQYCAEAEQNQVTDHEHDDENCQYCQEAEAAAQSSHDHTGDDCQYCQEAAAHDPNSDGHPSDCQYCNSAEAAPSSTSQGAADATVADSQDEMAAIAQEITETTPDGNAPADVAQQVAPTDDGGQNTPADMGLAEQQVPQDGNPDLSEVLQAGLDNHADSIAREKVISMVAEALEGFKACKPIIERSQQQAPQLYQSSLAMLKAMIEMAKMLGLAPKEENPLEQPGQSVPKAQPQPAAPPQGGQPEGKPMGR